MWIDNALELEHDSTDLGVPAGERHWDVISQALDEASVNSCPRLAELATIRVLP